MTIVITPDLDNPYIITMSWNDEILVTDPDTGELPIQNLGKEGAIVTATVTDEYGNLIVPGIYDWYLQDEPFAHQCETVILEGTLEVGFYQLNLIVEEDSILSSEYIKFLVEE